MPSSASSRRPAAARRGPAKWVARLLLLALLPLTAASVALCQEEEDLTAGLAEIDLHMKRGLELFQELKFPEAIVEFTAGVESYDGGTIQDVGLRLSQVILTEAIKRGANVVATACPLCQFNLECYQKEMSNRFHENVDIPVVYFTQLTGLALGLEPRRLGLHRLFMKFRLDQIAPIAKEAAHV